MVPTFIWGFTSLLSHTWNYTYHYVDITRYCFSRWEIDGNSMRQTTVTSFGRQETDDEILLRHFRSVPHHHHHLLSLHSKPSRHSRTDLSFPHGVDAGDNDWALCVVHLLSKHVDRLLHLQWLVMICVTLHQSEAEFQWQVFAPVFWDVMFFVLVHRFSFFYFNQLRLMDLVDFHTDLTFLEWY